MKSRLSVWSLFWLAAILLSWPSLTQAAGLHVPFALSASPLEVANAGIVRLAAFDVLPAQRAQNAATCPNPYIVRVGDTLSAIARRCGVTVENLRHWNNLFTYTIWPGQRLITRGPAILPLQRSTAPARAPLAAKTPVPPGQPRATPTPRIEPTISRW